MLPRAVYEQLREDERREAALIQEWMQWPAYWVRDEENERLVIYRPLPVGWWEDRLGDLATLNEILGKQCYTHREALPNDEEMIQTGLLIEAPGMLTMRPRRKRPSK